MSRLVLAIFACVLSLAYANDAFRDAAPVAGAPVPVVDRAAVDKNLKAEKQDNLKFEREQQEKEIEEAKKRALEQNRALLEKQQKEKEARVQQARLERQQAHAADTQEAKLKERHDFLLAQAKADQVAFLQGHPKNIQAIPRP